MKKFFYLLLTSFLAINSVLLVISCSKDDNDILGGENHTEKVDSNKVESKMIKKNSCHYGFKDEEEAKLYESNSYYRMSFDSYANDNMYLYPSSTKPFLNYAVYEYKYDTQKYWVMFGKKHYYTETTFCYSYYSYQIEWEDYYETKPGYYRYCRKNIKLSQTYLYCTPKTPSDSITNKGTATITLKDEIDDWTKIEEYSGGSTSGGNNSGGNNNDESSSSNKQRDYLFVTSTTCYKENGDNDKLYIYKKNGGSEIRASWVYSANGLDRAATEVVHYANKSINGVYFKYYICPYGISWYFNY